MDYINHLIDSLAAYGYPRWLVILGVGLAAVVAVWVLAKVLKWTLFLVLGALIIVVVLGGLFWLFG
ncbi:MAG TPA: hypothetical protein VFC28_10675 [Opitutaceae bacterium]|jgi:hypothetical protein|nr:hypothetical protein [Opitutaceae bacterium]